MSLELKDVSKMLKKVSSYNKCGKMSLCNLKVVVYLLSKFLEFKENRLYIDPDKLAKTLKVEISDLNESLFQLLNFNVLKEVEEIDMSNFFKFNPMDEWKDFDKVENKSNKEIENSNT